MKLRISTLILLLICAASAFAQSAPFPVTLEKELAARASNFTEVTLDKSMLSFASKFLNGKDSDDAKVRELIQKLDGIYVREYDFDKEDQYTTAEVESVRKQFAGSEWSPMVRERSKKGDGTDVYVKLVNGDIHGMFVLDAEPRELTFVFISGPIRPEDLNQLGGNFGIPKVSDGHGDDKGKGGQK
jgi:Domain of unknown function (DUF4252)